MASLLGFISTLLQIYFNTKNNFLIFFIIKSNQIIHSVPNKKLFFNHFSCVEWIIYQIRQHKIYNLQFAIEWIHWIRESQINFSWQSISRNRHPKVSVAEKCIMNEWIKRNIWFIFFKISIHSLNEFDSSAPSDSHHRNQYVIMK